MKCIFPLLFALTLLVGCSPQKAAVTPKPTPEGITPTPEPTPAPTQFRFTRESSSGPKTVKTFTATAVPPWRGATASVRAMMMTLPLSFSPPTARS